jgi:hypothetical protein
MAFPLRIRGTVILDRLTRFRIAMRRGMAGKGVPEIDAMFLQWATRYARDMRSRFNIFSRGGGDWPPLATSTLYARSRQAIARIYAGFKAGDFNRAERDVKLKRARRLIGTSMIRGNQAIGRIQADFRAGNISATKSMRMQRSVKKAMSRRSAAISPANASILRNTGVLFEALTINAAGNVSERRGPTQVYGIGGPAVHAGGNATATIGRIATYHQNGGALPGRPPQRKILVPVVKGSPLSQQMVNDAERAAARLLGNT